MKYERFPRKYKSYKASMVDNRDGERAILLI